MYMLMCLLLRRFNDWDDRSDDPLTRLSPDELADLPPFHPPQRNGSRHT